MPAPERGENPSDLRSDEALIDAINGGDVHAFEVLYERHKQWAANLAYRFTRDRELSFDVVQETFVYVLGKFPGFALRCRFRTFLYPVVRSLSITLQGRERKEQESLPADVVSARGLEGDAVGLRDAVEALPPGQREVVYLRFADDLPLAEIALALGVPEGTVKSRLHHALNTLRADPRAREFIDD